MAFILKQLLLKTHCVVGSQALFMVAPSMAWNVYPKKQFIYGCR